MGTMQYSFLALTFFKSIKACSAKYIHIGEFCYCSIMSVFSTAVQKPCVKGHMVSISIPLSEALLVVYLAHQKFPFLVVKLHLR